jgi:hypothetical protein
MGGAIDAAKLDGRVREKPRQLFVVRGRATDYEETPCPCPLHRVGQFERRPPVVRTTTDGAASRVIDQDPRRARHSEWPTCSATAGDAGIEGGSCAGEFGVIDAAFAGIRKAGVFEDTPRAMAGDGGIEAFAGEEVVDVDGGQEAIVDFRFALVD